MDDDAIDKLDVSSMTLSEIMADDSPEMRAAVQQVVAKVLAAPDQMEVTYWPIE